MPPQMRNRAMRPISRKRPDVAIVDINLPELSGFELLRKILRRDPDARIIMFSMNEDPAFAARALELGAKGFLTKNDDPGLLVEAVMKVAAGENFVTRHLAESRRSLRSRCGRTRHRFRRNASLRFCASLHAATPSTKSRRS